MMGSSGEQVSPLLLTSSFSDELQHEGEGLETEEEQQVPPFRSLVLDPLQLWWKRLQKPILVILLNLILVTLACVTIGHTVYAVLTWRDYSYVHASAAQHKKEVKLKTMASVGFTLLFLTCAMDAYICLHGARDLEKKALSSSAIAADGSVGEDLTLTDQTTPSPSATAAMETSPSQQQGVVGTNLDGATVNSKEEEEDSFDILAVSRSIDGMFGCDTLSSSPSSTFLVGLLYALFALAVWLLVVGIASVAYIQIVPDSREANMAYCLSGTFTRYPSSHGSSSQTERLKISWLANQPESQSLPLEVRTWLQSDGKEYPSHYGEPQNSSTSSHTTKDHDARMYYQGSLPYVRAIDGSTAFPFRRRNKDKYSDYQIVDRGVALVTTTGTTKEFPMNKAFFGQDTYDEGPVQLVGIPNRPPYQGWCGISAHPDPWVSRQEVLCYNGAGSSQQQEEVIQFPGEKHAKGKTHLSSWSDPQPTFYATDMTLWLALERHWSVRQNGGGGKESDMEHVSLTSYNIATMESKVVVETDRNKTHSHHSYQPVYPVALRSQCHHSRGVLLLVSVPVLCLLSFYLYRQDVPSSFVPLGLALFLVASSVLPSVWPWIVDMSIATLILLLLASKDGPWEVTTKLWKFVSMEMLLWLQYSLLVCHFVAIGVELVYTRSYYFGEGGSSFISLFILVPAVTFLVAAANAVVLNHPVMEAFGIGVGVLCLCSIPILMAIAPVFILPLPILLCALSFCCSGAGRLVRHIRLYLVVYCRRGCRALRKKRHGGC